MERETLEMDVVFVGAGPANLSGALHLARLIRTHNEAAKSNLLADAQTAETNTAGEITKRTQARRGRYTAFR